MRGLLALCGNLLLVASVAGFLLLVWDVFSSPGTSTNGVGVGAAAPTPEQSARTPQSGGAPGRASLVASAGREPKPISRVVIRSIGLDADVVSAQLVERDGGMTWQIPAFKVGHAESTASAGEPGNVVLLGHVSSRNAGNVFKDLDRARIGDAVDLFSGKQRFEYRVTDLRSVPRADTSSLQATDTPTATLVTCSGFWLPTLWDYTERLVVRATFVSSAPHSGTP